MKRTGIGVLLVSLAMLSCSGESTENVDVSVCESGLRWVEDGEGSPEMMPGETCVACHAGSDDAPRFGFAGTVYESGDQGTRCFGVEGVEVVVTDADGVEHKLVSNGSGNFYSGEMIPTPYRAKIVVDGQDIAMQTPQTNGDCNSCHRVGGAASQRIFTGR